ncbi:MAG: ribosome assembly cofactor RimP [Bacteroidales bacterium]|jgi:ribosome maturation factor RimP|nr:ribosome assembly cofactor RimP [Bacteroidales bacterium]
MITEEQVKQLVEDFLKGSDLFLIEVTVKPVNKIFVYIDGDNRVTIEACHHLSHFLELNLDRDKEDFELTVSSAGIDRPLQFPRQFKKNISNALDITTVTGETLTGKVISVDERGIEVELIPKKIKKIAEKIFLSLSFETIRSAKEVITFKK